MPTLEERAQRYIDEQGLSPFDAERRARMDMLAEEDPTPSPDLDEQIILAATGSAPVPMRAPLPEVEPPAFGEFEGVLSEVEDLERVEARRQYGGSNEPSEIERAVQEEREGRRLYPPGDRDIEVEQAIAARGTPGETWGDLFTRSVGARTVFPNEVLARDVTVREADREKRRAEIEAFDRKREEGLTGAVFNAIRPDDEELPMESGSAIVDAALGPLARAAEKVIPGSLGDFGELYIPGVAPYRVGSAMWEMGGERAAQVADLIDGAPGGDMDRAIIEAGSLLEPEEAGDASRMASGGMPLLPVGGTLGAGLALGLGAYMEQGGEVPAVAEDLLTAARTWTPGVEALDLWVGGKVGDQDRVRKMRAEKEATAVSENFATHARDWADQVAAGADPEEAALGLVGTLAQTDLPAVARGERLEGKATRALGDLTDADFDKAVDMPGLLDALQAFSEADIDRGEGRAAEGLGKAMTSLTTLPVAGHSGRRESRIGYLMNVAGGVIPELFYEADLGPAALAGMPLLAVGLGVQGLVADGVEGAKKNILDFGTGGAGIENMLASDAPIYDSMRDALGVQSYDRFRPQHSSYLARVFGTVAARQGGGIGHYMDISRGVEWEEGSFGEEYLSPGTDFDTAMKAYGVMLDFLFPFEEAAAAPVIASAVRLHRGAEGAKIASSFRRSGTGKTKAAARGAVAGAAPGLYSRIWKIGDQDGYTAVADAAQAAALEGVARGEDPMALMSRAEREVFEDVMRATGAPEGWRTEFTKAMQETAQRRIDGVRQVATYGTPADQALRDSDSYKRTAEAVDKMVADGRLRAEDKDAALNLFETLAYNMAARSGGDAAEFFDAFVLSVGDDTPTPAEVRGRGALEQDGRGTQAPVFYSAVDQGLSRLFRGNTQGMKGQSLLAKLKKQPNVKQEEIALLGLDEFLAGAGRVTEAEVRAYLEPKQIRVEEVVKGEEPPGIQEAQAEAAAALERKREALRALETVGREVQARQVPELKAEYDRLSEELKRRNEVGDNDISDPEFRDFYRRMENAWHAYKTLSDGGGGPMVVTPDGHLLVFDTQIAGEAVVYLPPDSRGFSRVMDPDDVDAYLQTPEAQAAAGDLIKLSAEAGERFDAEKAAEYKYGSLRRARSGSATKWSEYTHPGGEGYRELLLTMGRPDALVEIPGGRYFMRREEADFGGGYAVYLAHEDGDLEVVGRGASQKTALISAERGTKEDLGSDALPDEQPDYFSDHWDEPNILAHVRFDTVQDADGRKVLRLHEVQSDWHQAGRDEGYSLPVGEIAPEDAKALAEYERTVAEYDRATAKLGLSDSMQEDAYFARMQEFTPEEKDAWRSAAAAHSRAQREVMSRLSRGGNQPEWRVVDGQQRVSLIPGARPMSLREAFERTAQAGSVPDAPFKDTWHALAMKRMVRYAAENGYDAIAWPTGVDEAELMSVGGRVDRLAWVFDDPEDVEGGSLSGERDGGMIEASLDDATWENLEQYVGKEPAERLREEARRAAAEGRDTAFIEGDDLRANTAGMEAFYDEKLPNWARKFGKRYGARVGDMKVVVDPVYWGEDLSGADWSHAPDAVQTVHAMTITPKMRRAVLEEGLPLFQKDGAGGLPDAPMFDQLTEWWAPSWREELLSRLERGLASRRDIDLLQLDLEEIVLDRYPDGDARPDAELRWSRQSVARPRLVDGDGAMQERVLPAQRADVQSGDDLVDGEDAEAVYIIDYRGQPDRVDNFLVEVEGGYPLDYNNSMWFSTEEDARAAVERSEFVRSAMSNLSEHNAEVSARDAALQQIRAEADALRAALPARPKVQPLFQRADEAGARGPDDVAEAARLWAEQGTDSPYFQRWFGDSKVVDAKGKPLVVYHGTTKGGFVEFDPRESDRGFRGLYFTDDHHMAKGYSLSRWFHGDTVEEPSFIRSVDEYERVSGQEVRIDEDGAVTVEQADGYEGQFDSVEEFLEEVNTNPQDFFGTGSTVYGVYLSMKDPLVIDADYANWDEIPWGDEGETFSTHELDGMARDMGYDGIIIRNVADNAEATNTFGDVYVVFDPSQIKSAVGNRGTFDDSGNILFQRDGGFKTPAARDKAWEEARLDHYAGIPEPLTVPRAPASWLTVDNLRDAAVSADPGQPHLLDKAVRNVEEAMARWSRRKVLGSKRNWRAFLTEITGGAERVLEPPEGAMRFARDPDEVAKVYDALSDGQIEAAREGLALADEFRDAYTSGEVDPAVTAELVLWAILSRGSSAFPHEAGFIDAVSSGVRRFSQAAVEGRFDEAMLGEFLKWSEEALPEGSPGRGVKHNLNAYGNLFLTRMAKRVDTGPYEGMTGLQALHTMLSDPSMDGPSIRLEFSRFAFKVGIDNKVVSFLLLVSGRKDVLVIDRIQSRNLWDAAANRDRFKLYNIYDGFPVTKGQQKKARGPGDVRPWSSGPGLVAAVSGPRGLAVTMAIEDGLRPSVLEGARRAGLEEFGDLGSFHWLSWIGASDQEVGHGTLDALLRMAQGDEDPLIGTVSTEGRLNRMDFGVQYLRVGNGPPLLAVPWGGEVRIADATDWSAIRNEITKRGNNVVPKGFKVTQPDDPKRPWYEQPGVDVNRLGELLDQHTRRPTAAEVRRLGLDPVGRGEPGGGVVADGGARDGGGVGDEGGPLLQRGDDTSYADRRARVRAARDWPDNLLPNLRNVVPERYLRDLPYKPGQAMVTVYRSVPSDVGEIRPGDWVALRRSYAKQHGRGKVLTMEVPAEHVMWAGTDMDEFFYVPPDEAMLSDDGPLLQRAADPDDPKNLVVQHNLYPQEVIAAMDLGGLAVPSIAVARIEYPVDKFGPVTLLGDTDLVDPKKGVPTFDADVYSPTFPRREWKIDKRAVRRWEEQNLYEKQRRFGDTYADLEEAAASDRGDRRYNELADSPSMRSLYIERVLDQDFVPVERVRLDMPGVSDDPRVREAVASMDRRGWYNDWTTEAAQADVERLSEVVAAVLDEQAGVKAATKASQGRTGRAIDPEHTRRLLRQGVLDEDGVLEFSAVSRLLSDWQRLERGAEVDQLATARKAGDTIEQSEGGWSAYQDWVDETLAQFRKEPVFSPASGGRPRPFTLQNIVREIRRELRGSDGLTGDLGRTRSFGARRFGSLDEVKGARGSIVPGAEVDAAADAIKERFFGIVDRVEPFGGSGSRWRNNDAVEAALVDHYRTGRSLDETLRSNGFDGVPQDVVAEFQQVADDLRTMVTGYFEAKPQRAVGFDEFRAAVVPKGADAAVRQRLEEAGLKVYEYDPEVDGDRAAVTRQAAAENNLLFQKPGQPQVDTGVRGMFAAPTRLRDIDMAVKAAVHVFETGRFDTLVHETGHLIEWLMGPEWQSRMADVFDSDPDTGMLTRKGREQLANAFQWYWETEVAPNGMAAAAFQQARAGLADLWLRHRSKVPAGARRKADAAGLKQRTRFEVVGDDGRVLRQADGTEADFASEDVAQAWARDNGGKVQERLEDVALPTAASLMFDQLLKPHRIAESKWLRLQEGLAPKTMPTVKVPDEVGGLAETEAVRRAGQRREGARVDVRPRAVRQALGIKPGDEIGLPDLVSRAVGYVAAERFRKVYGGQPLVRLTRRTIVPRGRLSRIRQEANTRLAHALGAPSKDLVRSGAVEGSVIRLSPLQQEGLRQMANEVAMEPMGNLVHGSVLLDPRADLSEVPLEEINLLQEAYIDTRAGVGARRGRKIEAVPTSVGYALVDAVAKVPQALEREGASRPAQVVSGLKRRFQTERLGEGYVSPDVQELVEQTGRELGDAHLSILRSARDLVEGRSQDMATTLQGLRAELVDDLVPPVRPARVGIQVLDELSTGGARKTTMRVADDNSSLLHWLSRFEDASNPVTVREVLSGTVLEDFEGLLGEGREMLDPERRALQLLRHIRREGIQNVPDGGAAFASAMSYVQRGLDWRWKAIEQQAHDIVIAATGTRDANILLNVPRERLAEAYVAFYTGRWDSLADWVAKRGNETGLEQARRPGVDLNTARLEMLVRLKARSILGKLGPRLLRYGIDNSMDAVARLGGKGKNAVHDAAFMDRVLHYINNEVSWKAHRAEDATGDVVYVPPHPATGFDQAAYDVAHRLLAELGFKYGKGEWGRHMIGGQEYLLPNMLAEGLEDYLARAADVGSARGSARAQRVDARYLIEVGGRQVEVTEAELAQRRAVALRRGEPEPRVVQAVRRGIDDGRPERTVGGAALGAVAGAVAGEIAGIGAGPGAVAGATIAAAVPRWVPKNASSNVAKFMDGIVRYFPLTPSRIRMGVTVGALGIATAPYYVANFLGGPLMTYAERGAGGVAGAMKHPRMTTAVMARMWGDGLRTPRPDQGAAFGAQMGVAMGGAPGAAAGAAVGATAGTAIDAARKNRGPWSPSKTTHVTPDGRIYTADMLAEAFAVNGLNSSFVRAETATSLAEDLERMHRKGLRKIMDLDGFQDVLMDAATAIDNYWRIGVAIDALDEGHDIAKACEIARNALFDYADLTDWERKYARAALMFYSYLRKANDQMWRTVLTNPGRVLGQLRMLRGMHEWLLTEEDDPAEPMLFVGDLYDRRLVVAARAAQRDVAQTSKVMFLAPPIPMTDAVGMYVDLADAAAGDAQATRGLASMAAPWVQAPFVMATETDVFMGRKLEDMADIPPHLIEWDRMALGGLLTDTVLQARVGSAQGRNVRYPIYGSDERYVAGNAKAWWAIKNLHSVPGLGRQIDVFASMDQANLGPVEAVTAAGRAAQPVLDEAGWYDLLNAGVDAVADEPAGLERLQRPRAQEPGVGDTSDPRRGLTEGDARWTPRGFRAVPVPTGDAARDRIDRTLQMEAEADKRDAEDRLDVR